MNHFLFLFSLRTGKIGPSSRLAAWLLAFVAIFGWASLGAAPLKLNLTNSGPNLELTWINEPDVRLQTSLTLSGDWTDLPDAVSPYQTPIIQPKVFFRLRRVPVIQSLEPAFLPAAGGTIYLAGLNFTANTTLLLNGLPAGSVTFVDSSRLTVNVGPLATGVYAVSLINAGPSNVLANALTVNATGTSDEAPPGMAATALGEFRESAVDLAIPAPIGPGFVLARTYRSRFGPANSPMGKGWDFSGNISVEPSGNDVIIRDGDGRADKFFRQAGGTYTRPEFFREGTVSGQIFTLTFADKSRWVFRPFNAASAPGKIAQSIDRNGNTMTYAYNGTGQLTTVTDALNRAVQFAYNGSGLLTSVTDFAGRVVTYTYDANGNLATMTTPAVTGTPNGNDFPSGKTITYTYTSGNADQNLNHNLTGIIDNTGTVVMTNTYSTGTTPGALNYDRLVSSALGANPATVFSYEPQTPSPANRYATTQVYMNDPVGNVSQTLFDSRNRPVQTRQLTGRATPGVAVTAVGNQPTGKLRASDPAYFETTATYNLDSLPVQITEPRGNSMAMVYAGDANPATPVRERGNLLTFTQTPAPGVPSDQDFITEKFEYVSGFGTEEGVGGHDNESTSRPPRIGQCWVFAGLMNTSPAIIRGVPFTAPSSHMTKHTDPRGNVWTNQFDANGNLTSSQAPGIATGDSFEYNAAGQLTAHVRPADANGRRKRDTFSYYSNGTQKGFLQSAVEDAGAGGLAPTTTYAYDAVGNVTSVTDPRGNDTQFVFNQLDQLMQVKSAPGGGGVRSQLDRYYNSSLIFAEVPRTSLACGSYGDRILNFDEEGNPAPYPNLYIRYERNALGQLTSLTKEVSEGPYVSGEEPPTTTQFEYDANGQVTKVLSPLAVSGAAPFNTVHYKYDERGLPFQEISAPGSPDQSTTQYDYDANGNVSRVSEGLEGTPQITTMVAINPPKGLIVCYHGYSASPVTSGGGGTGPITTSGVNNLPTGIKLPPTRRYSLAVELAKHPLKQGRWTHFAVSVSLGTIGGPYYDIWRGGELPGRLLAAGGGVNDPFTDSGEIVRLNAQVTKEGPITFYVMRDTKASVRAIPGGGSTGAVVTIESDESLVRPYFWLGSDPIRASSRMFPATITDPLGNTTTNHFDASGNLVSTTVTSPSGPVGGASNVKLAETTYAYDALGRLTNATEAILDPTGTPTGSAATTSVFADNGQTTSVTDPLGHMTNYGYDSVGRLSIATDPKGNSTAYGYDANDNVTTVTNTLKSDLANPDLVFAKSFAYDKLNRCTSATDNVGNAETFAYDSRGNVVKTTDARGIVSQFEYDGLGRLTRSGRDMNNNGSTLDPVDIVTTQSWDANSRLTSQTDPNGNDTSYAYDSLDRLTQTIAADGTAHPATYDVHGNVVSSTDANGTVTTCNYDLNNRLLQKTILPALGVATTTSLETFSYDGLGRVTQASNNASATSFTYDSLGRTLTETQDGLTVTSTYDAAGKRLTVAYPGGRTIGYAYDTANLPTTVSLLASSDGEAPGVLSTNHYIGGQLERVDKRNNTRTSYSYNGVAGTANPLGDSGWGQVSRVQTTNFTSGAVIDDTTYRYDAAQNQTGKTTSFPGKVTATAYQYDAADRLMNTVVTTNGAQSANITYTLDKAGKRLNVTGDNHPGVYTLNSTLPEPADFQVNQYTTTPVGNFSYDKNGNRISETSGATTLRTFSYDYANRLVAINSGSTGAPIAVYSYDALGRRILKGTQSGATLNTTRYVYDGDEVIEERDGSNLLVYSTRDHYLKMSKDIQDSQIVFLNVNGIGSVTGHYTQKMWHDTQKIGLGYVTQRRNGTNYWPATDANGSTVALTLDNGTVAERYDYADYGEPTFFDGSGNAIPGSAVGSVYLFGGMLYDSESGIYVQRRKLKNMRKDLAREMTSLPQILDPRTGTSLATVPKTKLSLLGETGTPSP